MRDDPLKDELMRYARQASDEAFQPDAAAIHRRARRHYRLVAALSAVGVLLAAGLGVGVGLRGRGDTPTVSQPQPPVTSPAPAVTATTPTPSTTRAPAASHAPDSYVAGIGGRVAVLSTATGRIVRTLWGPSPAGTQVLAVGLSPDRKTVYFSAGSTDPCQQPGGISRVPFNGGSATKIVTDETAEGLITVSADGARLAYLALSCSSSGTTTTEIVLRDAGGALLHRWSGAFAGSAGMGAVKLALSADGRQLAAVVFDQLDPVGVRVLDATTGTSIADGRLVQAPDPDCGIVNATFHPGTGQLAVFERCLKDPRSGVPPRFRMVSLDPASGRLLSRSPLAFDDRSGADLHIESMDLDRSGRYLLYGVGSADPADSQQPHPQTGTWWFRSGRPVRVPDDQPESSRGGYLITAAYPGW